MTRIHKQPANWIYYSVTGNGRWQGEFMFRITNWKLFWRNKIGTWNRFFSILIHINGILFGPAKILLFLKVYPDIGPAGVVTSHGVIKFLGINLYVTDEYIVLFKDGKNGYVNSKQRLGPVPFLFKSRRRYPAIISEDGKKAGYPEVSLLGTLWKGDYIVGQESDNLNSVYSCSWAHATATIFKKINGPLAEQQYFIYPESVGEVISCLRRYRDWFDRNKDPRATFTHAYLFITETFQNEIPKKGFQDPEWVSELVFVFASEYLRAIQEYDMGTLNEGGWKLVFDAILTKRTSVVEELVLSIAAHIIQDLPVALNKMGSRDHSESSRIADFHLANDVLCDAIENLQDELSIRYNGFLRWLDRLGYKNDEILTSYGIRISRGMAWYNAIRLKSNHEEVAKSLRRSVGDVIKQIISPPFSLLFLFRIIRIISQLNRRWPKI